jgi:hypothetical protein
MSRSCYVHSSGAYRRVVLYVDTSGEIYCPPKRRYPPTRQCHNTKRTKVNKNAQNRERWKGSSLKYTLKCPLLWSVTLSAVFCLSVVFYFVWCVYFCVLYLILVPLPPGKNPFTVQLNTTTTNNNNKLVIYATAWTIRNSCQVSIGPVHHKQERDCVFFYSPAKETQNKSQIFVRFLISVANINDPCFRELRAMGTPITKDRAQIHCNI